MGLRVRLLLDQHIFEDDSRAPALWSLFLAVISREHALLLRPSWRRGASQPVERFLERSSGLPLRTLAVRALERSLDELRSGPRRRRPSEIATGTAAGAARVDLVDAVRLAWSPLWLVLENGRNDLNFLRHVLPRHDRVWLDRQIERGQIEVPPGGGTGEIEAFLEDLVTAPAEGQQLASARPTRVRAMRVWVMFDRDVDPKDVTQPSTTSERIHKLCVQGELPHCQLGRRTMESYLPLEALERWAKRGKDAEREAKKRFVRAFRRLTSQQQRTYSWKEGLRKDASASARKESKAGAELPAESLPPLFQKLSHNDRVTLTPGFGKKIGELWNSEDALPDWVDGVFTDPTDAAWRRALVTSLREAR